MHAQNEGSCITETGLLDLFLVNGVLIAPIDESGGPCRFRAPVVRLPSFNRQRLERVSAPGSAAMREVVVLARVHLLVE